MVKGVLLRWMRMGIYFGLLIFLLFLLLLILLLCFLFINVFLCTESDNDTDRCNNNDSNSNNNDNSNGSGSCGLVVTHIHMAYSQCWCCVYHSSVKLSPTNRPWEDHIRKTIRLCCFTREMINACHVIVYRRHHLLVSGVSKYALFPPWRLRTNIPLMNIFSSTGWLNNHDELSIPVKIR